MIRLKEALIGKKNIENATTNGNDGPYYIVFPFSGDSRTLDRHAKDKEVPTIGWDMYVLKEEDFPRIYGKSLEHVIHHVYSEKTIIWKTCNPIPQIWKDLEICNSRTLGTIKIMMSQDPDYEQIK